MNLIIMPFVCGAQMTKNAIVSALEQDVETYVLAISNGAQDGTTQAVRALRSQYPRLGLVEIASRRSLSKVWNEWITYAFDKMHLDYVLVVNNDVVLNQHTFRILRDSGLAFVSAVGQREPVRETPEFMEAESKVKIGHFTRQGLRVTGIVHVGANNGYEIEWYRKMGARVLAFEPVASVCKLARERYEHDEGVRIFQHALGEENKEGTMLVSQGDAQGSTFLPELRPTYPWVGTQHAEIARFDSLQLDLTGFNTLVVDVQGMELQVLKGFGEQLDSFDFLNIECSRVPLYEGGVPAQEVVDFLATKGFEQDSPICEHDDVLFIRKGCRLVDKRSPHPDFSCFLLRRECWERVGKFDEEIMAYTGDCDMHLRMHAAGVEAWSLPVPFEHIASGTLKNASNALRDAIQREAEADREYFKRKWGFLPGTPAYEEAFR